MHFQDYHHLASMRQHSPFPSSGGFQALHRVVVDKTTSKPPIGILPGELMQKIFAFCLPVTLHNPLPGPAARHNHHPAPVLLLQICSRWRTIALSTPELWISLTLQHPEDIPRCERWLKRAGRYRALSVSYDNTKHDIAYDLTAISSQIGELRLRLPSLDDEMQCLLAESSFDSLNTLSIAFPNTSSESRSSLHHPSLGALESLGDAPQLQRLSLSLPFVFAPTPEYLSGIFPWSQLTYLNIRTIHWSSFPTLLSLCPNVKQAIIGLHAPNVMVPEVPSSVRGGDGDEFVSLYQLESLTIISDHFLRLNILDGFYTPNLSSLSIQYEGPELPPRQWEPFRYSGHTHFLSQLANVRTFAISQKLPPHKMLEMLRHMPDLQKLNVTCWEQEHVDGLLDGLTVDVNNVDGEEREGQAGVLQKLREVEIDLKGPDTREVYATDGNKLIASRVVGHEMGCCARFECLVIRSGESGNLVDVVMG